MFSFCLRVLPKYIYFQKLPATNLQSVQFCQRATVALRPKKRTSSRKEAQYFSDSKQIRAVGGKGGDGCISFLQLWSNEKAGPDGGDGGSGGHVVFEASRDVKNLNHVTSLLKGNEGEKGMSQDCNGKNANHTIIKVPVGTIIRNTSGKIVGDLDNEKLMFVAARGGNGGKGNHFFTSDTQQAPQICEYGATGEDLVYHLELRSMADVGLIGLPNAGKSTLLRAISRACPKVASYPFTTLRPHIGMVQYDDYEQIAVADLPGLIPDSHKNKGLGIQFLKHAERCSVLLFVIDVSHDDAIKHYEALQYELEMFSPKLIERPKIIAANKIDMPNAKDNIAAFEDAKIPIIPTSAKFGTNISKLLEQIRHLYDQTKVKRQEP